jgi:RHS repeat-associated protein
VETGETGDSNRIKTVVEQGATKIINRYYNRADLTNVTGIVDALAAANNETLGYTDAARLSSASGAYGTRAWTYDGKGNRTVETRGGVPDIYNYPANSNKLLNVVRGSTALRVFTYDAAGNVTQNLRGANVLNYAINNAGRIRQMSYNNGAAVTDYVYVGFQKLRVKTSTSPAATTHYVWDSFGHIIAETSGAFTREYIWLGDTPLAINEGATLSYVHPDHLDRPVAMTTSSGPAVAWSARYDPFGNVVSITNAAAMPLRFPGQYFQIEDGLSYNWHRNYDPTLGRYSQADPLGFVDGPGVYNYAGGSPAMFVDPSGLDTPPANAWDPTGPKAPGHPGGHPDWPGDPKGGPNWVPNPNPGAGGSSHGWEDRKGDVWCPTGPGGRAHGGPHWDRQKPDGTHDNPRPPKPENEPAPSLPIGPTTPPKPRDFWPLLLPIITWILAS